jgi:hypothetical protein
MLGFWKLGFWNLRRTRQYDYIVRVVVTSGDTVYFGPFWTEKECEAFAAKLESACIRRYVRDHNVNVNLDDPLSKIKVRKMIISEMVQEPVYWPKRYGIIFSFGRAQQHAGEQNTARQS